MSANRSTKIVCYIIGIVVGLWRQAQKTRTIAGVDPTAQLPTSTKFAAFMDPTGLPGAMMLACLALGMLVIIAIVLPGLKAARQDSSQFTA